MNKLINTAYLLEKLKECSIWLGRATLRPALSLYFVMKAKETPSKDKWAIAMALAYLVLPIDLIPGKRLPVIGWLDEIASLLVVFSKMKNQVTPRIEARVEELLEAWLPAYTRYEVVE